MTENYDNVENDGSMAPPGVNGPHQVTEPTDQQLTSESNMVAAQSIDQPTENAGANGTDAFMTPGANNSKYIFLR